MDKVANSIYDVVWSPALVVVLLIAGLYFTIRTRCVQIRRVGLMARLLWANAKGSSSDGELSSFQAFCVALSGRIGTGNIVGVATAIALGGPGSVFWMWVIAFLGASTAFLESTLARMYRFKYDGEWRGGPAAYMEKGLGKRSLGVIFAVLTITGYGLLLAMVPSNCMAAAFSNSFSIPPKITACAIITLLFLIAAGGAGRIGKVSSVITPFMAFGYVVMALIILAFNIREIPGVFALIFKSAFGAAPAFAGMTGSAIAMGVKRGLFSNEAGQGGGAIVSASARVKHPAEQGLVQAFSVYIDTLLVCTATALMILVTGQYNVFGADGAAIVSNAPELGQNFVAYTQSAIDTVFNGFGGSFVAISLAFFSFTTLIAYSFYSESSISYILKDNPSRKKRDIIMWVYRLMLAGCIFFGACNDAVTIWTFGDIGLGITTWINIMVLFILCPIAIKGLREYEATLRRRK